jgi:hypothetical protein
MRNHVLEQVLNDYHGGADRQPGRLPLYASVSQEWQHFFERVTFASVHVTQDDLEEFQNIVTRRHSNNISAPRLRIRYISLRVVLLPYCEYPLQDQTPACYHCREPENLYEAEKNDVIFTNALWQLLEVLVLMGTYRGQGGAIGPLWLDFSAHSPSDAHHYFQWYHLQPDYPRFRVGDRVDYVRRWCTDPACIPVNDPGHGYGPDRAS